MHRLILAVVVAATCLAASGCMTFDLDHDRKILGYFQSDIRAIHEDLDFIFYVDQEGNINEIYMR